MTETILRLFISSPSDVREERARVEAVTRRLDTEFAGRVRFEVFRWEDGFYTAARSFQATIEEAVAGMRATSMVVCILWKRIGTPLDPAIWRRPDGSFYESGTVLEVEQAVAVARQNRGVPDVYLFRKTAPVLYSAESFETERAQHAALETVWRRWTTSEDGHNVAGSQKFGTPDEFETKLEACLRQWLARRGVAAEIAAWDRSHGSPFPGLDPFDTERGPVFFGRDLAIAHALARLREASTRGLPFLLLIGASGSGKSSLLRAGLLPRLIIPGTIPGVDLWRAAVVVIRRDPLVALAEALFAETALGPELLQGDFDTPQALARHFEVAAAGRRDDRFVAAIAPVARALRRAAESHAADMSYEAPRPAKLALGVDQTERLFIEAETGSAAFGGILAAFVQEGLAYVLVTLRSDAYPAFQLQPALLALRTTGAGFDLVPPTAAELREIVTRPVAACRPPLAFEVRSDGEKVSLADVLVAEAKGGDALALLQMTLARLYKAEAARGDGMLRFDDYRGIAAAVTETAEEALRTLDTRARSQVPALIAGLLDDVAADPITGAPVPVVAPLDRAAFEQGEPARRQLVDAFVTRRLLTVEADAGAPRLRPAHDALLRIWPQAVEFVAETADLIRVRRTLEPIARDWARAPAGDRRRHEEISVALLAGGQRLVERMGRDLPAPLRDFVTAAEAAADERAHQERNEQERQLRDAHALAVAQRRIARLAVAGLVVSLVLVGLAVWQWRAAVSASREAKAQRDRAERSLALATDTANGLIFDVAHRFRETKGVPLATVKAILERARRLQELLLKGGEKSARLKLSEAAGLNEMADTLLTLGDTGAALTATTQAHEIFVAMLAQRPKDGDIERELAVSLDLLGRIHTQQGDLPRAQVYFVALKDILQRQAGAKPGDAKRQHDLSIAFEHVGTVALARGRLGEALASYQSELSIIERLARAEPGNAQWQGSLAVARNKMGGVYAALGRLDEALQAYMAARDILLRLISVSPADTGPQRDLAVIGDMIGDILLAQGRSQDALSSLRDALVIKERLAATDPANTEWRHDVSNSQEKIGDVLMQQGNVAGALATFRKGLEIRQQLAAADPRNAEWRRDLSILYGRVGDALLAMGNLHEAEASFRVELAISLELAKQDPGNAEWNRDLSVSQEKLGDALMEQDKPGAALEQFRPALVIRERLAASDPSNAVWQRDLALVHGRIGRALLMSKKLPEAVDAANAAAAVTDRLSKRDPRNVGWQRDLSIAYDQVGDVRSAQGDLASALASYRSASAIRDRLLQGNPANPVWQRDVSVSREKIGNVLAAQGRLIEALGEFQAGLDIRKRLTQSDPTNIGWQRDLAIAYGLIGSLELKQEHADKAHAAFAAALSIYDALLRSRPDDRQLRLMSAVPLVSLGALDDEHRREYFTRALKIITDLDPDRKPAIAWLEAQLKQH